MQPLWLNNQRQLTGAEPLLAWLYWNNAALGFTSAMARYTSSFNIPLAISMMYFQAVEQERLVKLSPSDSFQAYSELAHMNTEMWWRSINGLIKVAGSYAGKELQRGIQALQRSISGEEGENWLDFTSSQNDLMEMVANGYPQAILAIKDEFGLKPGTAEYVKVDETDRFELIQVMPLKPNLPVRADGKPILVLPPYVLGANILSFLPGEQRSYVHNYANLGVPTYIRVLKTIDDTPALQTMTAEEDTLDTKKFCQTIRQRHGRPVTLNGYCQGGFSAVCNILSGELDDLVDALITCVAPMDGTRSKGLAAFLNKLPARFNDLAYGTKRLPNGNVVADGLLMGWVYKLRSIEHESPLVALLRDMTMFNRTNGSAVSKTAAALNYWLTYERFDLPMAITEMSFSSYNTPISPEGTLPVTLFDRKLNFTRLREKKIPWLICYGIHDDLVEKETALAPLDWVNAEVSPFPKGHVAIATSWSHPDSACALHTRFGEGHFRGPVRFHLDLEAEADEKKQATTAKAAPSGKSASASDSDTAGTPAAKPKSKAKARPATAKRKPRARAKAGAKSTAGAKSAAPKA